MGVWHRWDGIQTRETTRAIGWFFHFPDLGRERDVEADGGVSAGKPDKRGPRLSLMTGPWRRPWSLTAHRPAGTIWCLSPTATRPSKTRVAQKAPGCDIVVVMSTLTGLSHGGPQTMLTSKDTGAFPHELGHTLGRLGDEYNSPTRPADRETFQIPRSGDLN